MKNFMTACGWLIAFFFATGSMAAPLSEATNIAPPQPIENSSPIFPPGSLGDEAWIQLSFTVKANGSTADFAVIDGFGLDAFKDAAIAAAKNWKFSPALADGKPTDWSNYAIDIFFTYPNIVAGGYPPFKKSYRDISKLLQDKKYAEAKAAIEAAQSSHTIRLLYEYAVLQTLLYTTETGLGHPIAAYRAIRSATPDVKINRRPQEPELGSRINKKVQLSATALLPDTVLKAALRTRFAAEANLGLYGEALATYDRIAAFEQIAPTDPIIAQQKLIHDALAADQPLGVSARIENGIWFNRPVRRKFALVQVKGTVDKIKVSCNRQSEEMAYKAGAQWELPPAWGDCEIQVGGADNTEFVFVQTGDAITGRTASREPIVVLSPDKQYDIPVQIVPTRPGDSGGPF